MYTARREVRHGGRIIGYVADVPRPMSATRDKELHVAINVDGKRISDKEHTFVQWAQDELRVHLGLEQI